MTARAGTLQKVGNVTIIGVLPQDRNASLALKLIAPNQFIVDFRKNLLSPPKEIHQNRYLPIGLGRLTQVLNLKSEAEFQTSTAVDQRFQELARYLLGGGFSPIFLVDAGPAEQKIRQALESLSGLTVTPKPAQLQEVQNKVSQIVSQKPAIAKLADPLFSSTAAATATDQPLSKFLDKKPEVFLVTLIQADLPTVAAYKKEVKLKISQVLDQARVGGLTKQETRAVEILQGYSQTAEIVENLKIKHPTLDRFLRKIAPQSTPVQSHLGKIWGGISSEAATLYLAKSKGLSYGVGWLTGKAVDWTEDRIFVRTLKTHAYDERGRRRFRPLMAFNRKVYQTFHVRDEKGRMRFRPTYAAGRSFAQSRVGQKSIAAFRKITSPFVKAQKAISGVIGKFLKPLTKLGGRILGVLTVAKILIKAGWEISKKALKWIGGGALGLYLYFLMQGLLPVIIGATIGFLAGGTVGTIAGAIVGAKVGATIGATIGSFVAPGIGTVVGGVIGGVVGAITGAIIGGSLGALIGTAIGGAVGYVAAGHAGGVATLTGATVGAGIGFAVGGPFGAVVGAIIGGAAGYAFGKYVIPGTKAAAQATGGLISAAAGSIGGFFATVGDWLASAGQAFWGGITTGASWLSGAVSGVTSFLSSVSVSPAVSAVPIGGLAIGAPVAVLVVGITAGAAFFNPYQTLGVPQKSEFIEVLKIATPTRIENQDLPSSIGFEIKITAKKNLTEIICIDETKLIRGDGSSQTILKPVIPCPATMTNGQIFSFGFPVTADSSMADSTVVNRITVKAQIEGGGQRVSQADAVVVIGTPPITNLPSGWPTTGTVTQKSNVCAPSHCSLEAIDISNTTGTSICAAHSGIATTINEGDAGPYGTTGLGNYVMITSFDGSVSSFYGHLSSFNISGGPVTAGTKIGEMGESGCSGCGSHLHYEFWGIEMDQPYIPIAEGDLVPYETTVTGCEL